MSQFIVDNWSKEDRVDAFADDASIFLFPKVSDLNNLCEILTSFGKASNLHLNAKKTTISPINLDLNQELMHTIQHLGYKIELNSINILGHEIKFTNPFCAKKSWNKVISQLNFYAHRISNLNLPLTSVIIAIKTFILPRLS